MKRKKYVIIGTIAVFLMACAWFVYYGFFDFDPYTISADYKTLQIQGTTYIFTSLADQTKTELKKHAIGKTQNGDLVCELVKDPDHHQVVLIQNTEMPEWELFTKK